MLNPVVKKYLILGLIFLAGFGIDHFIFKVSGSDDVSLKKIHLASSNYKFTNPMLGVDISGADQFSEYKPLAKKVNQIIEAEKNKGNIQTIAFYFRDLEKGQWVGVDENQTFDAASLFKIPVMMAYYKKAEYSPKFLSSQVYVNDQRTADDPDKQFDSGIIKSGSYTLDQLIESMIKYSDNQAKDVLVYAAENNFGIDYKSLENVFTDLGVFVTNDQNQHLVSPKIYSLFFRVLYNSTYLSQDMSEKALNLLSQTTFDKGITAGLPKDIVVSHKFGYYFNITENKHELHDCGVVYYPSNPYLLCIMTKGDDVASLETAIKNISQGVFEEIK